MYCTYHGRKPRKKKWQNLLPLTQMFIFKGFVFIIQLYIQNVSVLIHVFFDRFHSDSMILWFLMHHTLIAAMEHMFTFSCNEILSFLYKFIYFDLYKLWTDI